MDSEPLSFNMPVSMSRVRNFKPSRLVGMAVDVTVINDMGEGKEGPSRGEGP